MALVEIGRFNNSFEAGIARSRLAAEGVESFVFDDQMSWEGFGGIIPIRLMVLEEELDLACEILEADESEDLSPDSGE